MNLQAIYDTFSTVRGAIDYYSIKGISNTMTLRIDSSIQVCPQKIFTFKCPQNFSDRLLLFANSLTDSQKTQRRSSPSAGDYYLLGENERNTPEFIEFRLWLEECLESAREHIVWDKKRFPKLCLTQGWLNILSKFDSLAMHPHPLSILSGVMCLSKEIDLDLFVSSIYSLPPFFCSNSGESDLLIKQTLKLSRGDMILFPSSLRHSVSTYQGESKRMSFAFNSFFKGKIGSDDDLASLEVYPNILE